MDFELKFVDPNEKRGVLGDLRSTRVAVLNDDKFPNDVKDLTNHNDVLFGFIIHHFYHFKSDVYKAMFWKLAPGIVFIFDQLITQKMIKTVSLAFLIREHGGDASEYTNYIVFLGVAYFLNFLLDYYADIQFCKLRMGGKASLALRSMCMDTVSQLTPAFEETFDVGRVMKTAEVAVDGAIDMSWMGCFTVCASPPPSSPNPCYLT